MDFLIQSQNQNQSQNEVSGPCHSMKKKLYDFLTVLDPLLTHFK